MVERAVIDRFEGNKAVLMVISSADRSDRLVREAVEAADPQGSLCDDPRTPPRLETPMVVKRSSLPKGAKEGDWLEVEFDGVRLVNAKLDAEAKARMEARIAEKLRRLRKRKG